MSKIMIYVLIGMLTFIAGCEVNNDYVFDDISTHRITKYIEECEAVLQEAPHGWKLVYYPDTSQYGAFTFLMRFHDGNRVAMQWDGDQDVTESNYSFNTSQGPILSFGTYSLLHKLADPTPDVIGGKPGLGFGGEYEFLIQNVSDRKIEFLSKKKKRKVILEWAGAEDWDNMEHNREMVQRFAVDPQLPLYHYLQIGDQLACFLYSQKMRMVYMVCPEGNSVQAYRLPWSSTPRGIRFDEPVTFAGITFSEVTIDANGVMSIVDADEKGHFFRAENKEQNCLVRYPGAVAASKKYDGFNLVECGSGFDVLVPKDRGVEEFRFYWNLAGYAGVELYMRRETGIATYATLYPHTIVDDGIGDCIVFTKPEFPRYEIGGAVTNTDYSWFGFSYEKILEPLFLTSEGLTVLAFGKQTFIVKNGDSTVWGLCSAKEGRD